MQNDQLFNLVVENQVESGLGGAEAKEAGGGVGRPPGGPAAKTYPGAQPTSERASVAGGIR